MRLVLPDETMMICDRVNVDDPLARDLVARGLAQAIRGSGHGHKQRVAIVCVGTDRSTGDSLGPLVGSKLKHVLGESVHVIGTLDDPVHAGNLSRVSEEIPDPDDCCVIAVDACLGSLDSVGHISIRTGALRPGAGVNKDLPEVGHVHIAGVVNVGGFMEYLVLQNTRLSLVMRMAEVIAAGILMYLSPDRLS